MLAGCGRRHNALGVIVFVLRSVEGVRCGLNLNALLCPALAVSLLAVSLLAVTGTATAQPSVKHGANAKQAARITAPATAGGPAAMPRQDRPANTHTAATAAGSLKAVIRARDTDRLVWPGAKRAVTIDLRNDGSEDIRDIIVELHSRNATLADVSGGNMRWRRTDHGWLAALPLLNAGSVLPVTLEIVLNAPPEPDGTANDRQPAVGRALNQIEISLKPRSRSEPVTAAADWQVTDCAAEYFAQLAPLRDGPAGSLKTVLKESRGGDRSLPGRWRFKPDRRGLPEELRDTYSLASTIVARRGSDPYLRSDNIVWLTDRAARDLRFYLRQDISPGLCATPDPMLDHWQKRLAPLAKRAASVFEQRNLGMEYARTQTDLALERLDAQLAENRADKTPARFTPKTLMEAILLLARRAGFSDIAITDITASTNVGSALDIAQSELKRNPLFAAGKIGRKITANPIAAILDDAFAAIELAHYLDFAAARYEAVYGTFRDSISAIRQTSAAACTCAY